MNKQDLIKLLENLNFPKEEYYVLSGSCMVLYGLREIANDLDLCISEELFELIKNKHSNIELVPNECGFYKIDSNIEVVVNKRENFEFDIVDGYQVEKLESILNWKIKQGREKDLLDIEKIQKFLEFINIETINELSEYMQSNLKYFWKDKTGRIREDFNETMFIEYSLMMPIEVLLDKYGICMDQVELERVWFKHKNINYKTICIQLLREDSTPGHVFIVYEENGNWHWFENAWYNMKGIHEYSNLDLCLEDITSKFIKQNNILDVELDNLELYEYDEYPAHINYKEIEEYDILNNNKKYIKRCNK